MQIGLTASAAADRVTDEDEGTGLRKICSARLGDELRQQQAGQQGTSTAGSSNAFARPAAACTSSSGRTTPELPDNNLVYRKHSSGDLQSRLKTRKVLGVGEIDDGDVHRSKISQILGHSEHLYRKLPRGLWVWQIFEALVFTFFATMVLLFPVSSYEFLLAAETCPGSVLAMRCYGCALLSLGVMWWYVQGTNDRGTIRLCLLASSVYYSLQIIASLMMLIQPPSGGVSLWRVVVSLVLRVAFAAVNISYLQAIHHPGFRCSIARCSLVTDKDGQEVPRKD